MEMMHQSVNIFYRIMKLKSRDEGAGLNYQQELMSAAVFMKGETEKTGEKKGKWGRIQLLGN